MSTSLMLGVILTIEAIRHSYSIVLLIADESNMHMKFKLLIIGINNESGKVWV